MNTQYSCLTNIIFLPYHLNSELSEKHEIKQEQRLSIYLSIIVYLIYYLPIYNIFARKPCTQSGTPMHKVDKVNPITQSHFKHKSQWSKQVTQLIRLAELCKFHGNRCGFSEWTGVVNVINLQQVTIGPQIGSQTFTDICSR